MTDDGQLDRIGGDGLARAIGLSVAELADAVMGETDRKNTDRAFAGDWQAWLTFCESAQQSGLDVLPLTVSADALVVFAKWLGAGGLMPDGQPRKPAAPESIRRRVTGVLAGWRSAGLNYPRGVTGRARQWVNDHEAKLIETKQSTGRGQAPALEIADARRIVAAAPDTLAGLRDIALVLVGFAIAARRSELAFLDVDDFAPGERGLYVHVRRSKTGARRSVMTFGQRESTCPVRAWHRWREAAQLADGGPAFRRIDQHGHLLGRLSGEACGNIVTRAGHRAGLELRLTGHSLRAGLATEAYRAGRPAHKIADQGGWRRGSTALQGYIRRVDEWSDSVLDGIGL
jgi:integrase